MSKFSFLKGISKETYDMSHIMWYVSFEIPMGYKILFGIDITVYKHVKLYLIIE